MSDVRTIAMDEDELTHLERRLMVAAAKIKSTHRGNDLATSDGDEGDGDEEDSEVLTDTVDEITDAARKGVRMARFAESWPLIPLFEKKDLELPTRFQVAHETQGYDFYLVRVGFSTLLDEDTFPLSAVLDLKLEDDGQDPARKVRPAGLFPERKDTTFFSLDIEGGIGLDTEMELVVPEEAGKVLPLKKLDADAQAKAKMVLGPFKFAFKRSEISVSGQSSDEIQWRYTYPKKIPGTHDFESYLVLKVAQEIREVKVHATVKVKPAKTRWLVFKELLGEFPDSGTLNVELVHRAPPA